MQMLLCIFEELFHCLSFFLYNSVIITFLSNRRGVINPIYAKELIYGKSEEGRAFQGSWSGNQFDSLVKNDLDI